MTSYCVYFRLGPALDLATHQIWITAKDMPEAVERLHHKLYHKFPNYKIQSVLPTNLVVAEDLVESWRDRV